MICFCHSRSPPSSPPNVNNAPKTNLMGVFCVTPSRGAAGVRAQRGGAWAAVPPRGGLSGSGARVEGVGRDGGVLGQLSMRR